MEEAFQPKTFTVHLKKGVFPTPVCAKDPKSLPYTRKLRLQLVFDESPYLPPEMWTPERRHPADSLMVWKWVPLGPGIRGHGIVHDQRTAWLCNGFGLRLDMLLVLVSWFIALCTMRNAPEVSKDASCWPSR